MDRLFIIFSVLIFIGCNNNPSLNFNETPQDKVDLDLLLADSHITSKTVEDGLGDVPLGEEDLSSEVGEEIEVKKEEPPKTKWTQDLQKRTQPSSKKSKKAFDRDRGQSSSDFISDDDDSTHDELDLTITDRPAYKTDILFIVDNSFSMKPVLQSIYNRMIGFTQPLNKMDWRAAFIDANVEDKKVNKDLMSLEYNGEIVINRKFVSKGTHDSYQILLDTLTRVPTHRCQNPPYCGGRKEKPVQALSKFLRSGPQGFIREDATLSVLILTDNEESLKSSTSENVVSEALNTLKDNYGDKDMKVYALVVDDSSCSKEIRRSATPYREGHKSVTSMRLASATGGQSFSLCSASYVKVSEQIARDHQVSI